MKIAIINGPNLNLLERRNPDIYGPETLDHTMSQLRLDFNDIDLECHQSNSEGEIINLIHLYGFDSECAGIVLNPGAYAHYSLAIADAIEAVENPVIEVHISNIHAREEFRHKSVTARAARALIAGCGRDGYALAILYLVRLSN